MRKWTEEFRILPAGGETWFAGANTESGFAGCWGQIANEGELERLEKALEALEKTVNAEILDVHAITEADCEFHNCIIALTHNPQLMTLSDYINRITVPSRERTTETVVRNGQVQSYGRLHRELYEIIRDRNKTAIEQTVLNHYIFWKEHNPAEA